MNSRRDLSRSICNFQNVNLPCLDSIGFPQWFNVIGLSLTTLFNSFYLFQVLWLNWTSFIRRLKYIKSNFLFLIPSNSLCFSVLPFTSTWKLVKDATNYVLMNMIGSAHTSREILEDHRCFTAVSDWMTDGPFFNSSTQNACLHSTQARKMRAWPWEFCVVEYLSILTSINRISNLTLIDIRGD